jgi:hypothetical protein
MMNQNMSKDYATTRPNLGIFKIILNCSGNTLGFRVSIETILVSRENQLDSRVNDGPDSGYGSIVPVIPREPCHAEPKFCLENRRCHHTPELKDGKNKVFH